MGGAGWVDGTVEGCEVDKRERRKKDFVTSISSFVGDDKKKEKKKIS